MNNLVIKLRETTGAGVMECKRALEKAGGNLDKAVEFIHEAGLLKAESKKERKTGAGLIHTYIHNERVGGYFGSAGRDGFRGALRAFQRAGA